MPDSDERELGRKDRDREQPSVASQESGGGLKLLQITKLYTVFDVKDDEAAAVKSFK